MLKDGSTTPFWIRNLQMYSCGIVSAGFSVMLTESDKINQDGFFHGYNWNVLFIVGWYCEKKIPSRLASNLSKMLKEMILV